MKENTMHTTQTPTVSPSIGREITDFDMVGNSPTTITVYDGGWNALRTLLAQRTETVEIYTWRAGRMYGAILSVQPDGDLIEAHSAQRFPDIETFSTELVSETERILPGEGNIGVHVRRELGPTDDEVPRLSRAVVDA
jgi:hypothetical protein